MQHVLKSVSGPAFHGGMLSMSMDPLGEVARIHSTQIFQQTSPIEISKFDFETGQFQEPEIYEPDSLDIDEMNPAFVMVTNRHRRLKLNYSPQNLGAPSFIDKSMIKTQILYGHNIEKVNISQLLTQSDSLYEGPVNLAYSYRGCCWLNLEPDNNNMKVVIVASNSSNEVESDAIKNRDFENRDLRFRMAGFMRNLKNPSPRMIVPSQWFLNPGCDSSMKLYPFIPNLNSIKCRWATYHEALGGAYNPVVWPSISLTKDCLLKYNASKELILTH